MFDKIYATLNINTTSIRLLSVKGRLIDKWDSLPLAPGLIRDGLILKPNVVGAVINALFESTGVSRERVITCMTGLPFTYRILRLPQMKPASLNEAIQRGAKKEMPLPLEDLYLSWQAINSRQDELDFLVLGVPRKPVDALVQMLVEIGVKPYLMDLKPLSLARAANRGDVIIVDLEPNCYDISLIANGVPAVMHAITPKGEWSNLEDNIQLLTNELSKIAEFYNSNLPENLLSPTTPLLLTGELSTDTMASELIQANTGYPVEPLVPPLELPPDLPVASFATNIGLVLKKAPLKTVARGDATPFHDINLNILSGKYGISTGRINFWHILLTIALIISIGLLAPIYQLRGQAYAENMSLQAELNKASQDLNQMLFAVSKSKQIKGTMDEILAEVETTKDEHQNILSKKGDYANDLKFITGAVPEKAYFTSLEIDTDQIILEGEADSPFSVISYVATLEISEKFSEIRIAWIDKSKSIGNEEAKVENTGVSFRIVITK